MKPTMLVAQARLESPLGPLTAAATAQGLAGLWFDGQAHHPGPLDAPVDPGQRWIAQAGHELARYWACGGCDFAVRLDLQGTPFQQSVWHALRAIAPGALQTYAKVAQRIGAPGSVRATAAAIGRNPVSIIVPCHRVVGSDGALTGYAGGVQRKQALLQREGSRP
jgi:methylated-DNA-[protein]-cysteine S-methyltransferase